VRQQQADRHLQEDEMPKKSESSDKRGQSSGNFRNDPERAAEAGRKGGQAGGQASGGNFKNDPERAAEAGRKVSRRLRQKTIRPANEPGG
jgi:general stress protein YciG